MSEDIALTLDHVALVTNDLASSREDYEKLGFLLTPSSSHKGAIEPGGPVEPWGSGNHCAMFRQGYYEILGLTDPDRYHDHFRSLLDRFHGVSLVALGCESASELYRARKDRIPALREPVEVSRDVPVGISGETTRPGLFRIVHLDEEAFPDAELFFIEHATPDVLWQAELLDHPNGVIGLEGVTICSDGPEKTAERFERSTLLPRSEIEGALHFALEDGRISVTSPSEIASRYREAVLPAVPCVAVVSLEVRELEATRAYLEGRGVTAHVGERGVWIRPERTGGVILEFV